MFGSVLLLNIQSFCGEVSAGTRQWIQDVSTNHDVQERLKELLHVHTEGFMVVPDVFVQ
jgi:hypothetical protein